MSDYKTGNSGSVYNYNENVNSYKCAECSQSLSDNETYEAYGKIYCGTCYQGK
jgi:DNA-directed RNA polymerase subunit RPC12/RpoP